MSRSLAKVRQRAEWGVLKARGMTPDRKSKLQEEHRTIVAALRCGSSQSRPSAGTDFTSQAYFAGPKLYVRGPIWGLALTPLSVLPFPNASLWLKLRSVD